MELGCAPDAEAPDRVRKTKTGIQSGRDPREGGDRETEEERKANRPTHPHEIEIGLEQEASRPSRPPVEGGGLWWPKTPANAVATFVNIRSGACRPHAAASRARIPSRVTADPPLTSFEPGVVSCRGYLTTNPHTLRATTWRRGCDPFWRFRMN